MTSVSLENQVFTFKEGVIKTNVGFSLSTHVLISDIVLRIKWDVIEMTNPFKLYVTYVDTIGNKIQALFVKHSPKNEIWLLFKPNQTKKYKDFKCRFILLDYAGTIKNHIGLNVEALKFDINEVELNSQYEIADNADIL